MGGGTHVDVAVHLLHSSPVALAVAWTDLANADSFCDVWIALECNSAIDMNGRDRIRADSLRAKLAFARTSEKEEGTYYLSWWLPSALSSSSVSASASCPSIDAWQTCFRAATTTIVVNGNEDAAASCATIMQQWLWCHGQAY